MEDFIYLNDGALLVSVSSGAVELSTRSFLELADLHEEDDIRIRWEDVNEVYEFVSYHPRYPDRPRNHLYTLFHRSGDG